MRSHISHTDPEGSISQHQPTLLGLPGSGMLTLLAPLNAIREHAKPRPIARFDFHAG